MDCAVDCAGEVEGKSCSGVLSVFFFAWVCAGAVGVVPMVAAGVVSAGAVPRVDAAALATGLPGAGAPGPRGAG